MANPFGMEAGEYGYMQDFEEIIRDAREGVADFANFMHEETSRLRETMYMRTASFAPSFHQAMAQRAWTATRGDPRGRESAEAYFAEYARSLLATGGAGGGAPPGGGGAPPRGGGGGRADWLRGRAEGFEAGRRAGGGGRGEEELAAIAEREARAVRRNINYHLWYMRVISQQIQIVERLGQQLIRTSTNWAQYAAWTEEAANVAADAGRTHGELSTIIREQREVAAQMRGELGEALLPAYKDSIEIVTNLKQSVADLSDGWQATIGVTTAVVGIFLKVSAAIALAVVTAGMAKIAFLSLNVGMQASILTAMQYGVVIGMVVAAGAALSISWSRIKSDLQEAADILREHAMRWDLSRAAMIEMAQAYYENLNLIGKAMFNLAGGMDAFIDKMMTGGSELGTVFEQAVKSAEAMVLPAAQAFKSLADAQSDIQNEMLTKRREYARVMERIDSGMYDAQDVAQATALQAQMRQLEIADMRTLEAHREQAGQLVLQMISAWESAGRIDVERALEYRRETMLEYGMITPESLAEAERFAEQFKPFAAGIPGATFEAGAAQIAAGTVTVTSETVELIAGNVTLTVDEAGMAAFAAGAAAYAKITEERTLGEEVRTQGVRTRR